MKARDNPNISKPVKNLWRFKVRSDLPNQTFYLYFTNEKAGIDYMDSEYSLETKQDMQCSLCKNLDPNFFYTDYKTGDTICTGPSGRGCGNVLQDHIVNRGREHVTHEEETDKNHHGMQFASLII